MYDNICKFLAENFKLDNQEYEIPVYAGDELTEILLSSEWLEFLPLVVNFQAGILTLG
jgi:predicted aspartyl protease